MVFTLAKSFESSPTSNSTCFEFLISFGLGAAAISSNIDWLTQTVVERSEHHALRFVRVFILLGKETPIRDQAVGTLEYVLEASWTAESFRI